MGYRIHLNLIKKSRFDKYYLKYYKDSGKDDCPWYLPDVADESIELFDELDIGQFKKLKLKGNHEYHPYVLKKKELKIIIDFYQEHLLDQANKKLEQIDELKEQINKDEKFTNDTLSRSIEIINLFQSLCFSSKLHFESLIGKNIQSEDDGYFLLQYFYLVRIYENYNSKKDVLIVTHG